MWPVLIGMLLLQSTPSTPGALREGLAEYGNKNYKRAIELLTPAVETLKPGTPAYNEAVLALGQSHYLVGRFPEAAKWLEKRRDTKSRPEVEYMLSQTYLQLGDVPKARTLLAALFGAGADSAAAHAITARMLVRMARNKDAVEELQKAVAADPGQPDLHLMLGELTLAADQAETAAKHFRASLTLDPSAPAAWLGLGEAESRLERWPEAIPALQKSIWLNPHVAPPYVALGKAYLRVKSVSNAETMLRKALEIDPRNTSAQNLLQQTLRQSNH